MHLQLDPALRNDLTELIASSFRVDDVNELGRLVLGRFDANEAAGTRSHVSLSARKGAGLLVEWCEKEGRTESLLKLVVEVDNGVLHGRPVTVKGLEGFLSKLTRSGIHYDFRTRRLSAACRDPDELPNWGCLKDGREYDVAVVSLDIVGSSAKTRRLGTQRMEKLSFGLWSFVRQKLAAFDGRIWSWAGDGGLLAFALEDHAARAVRFAIEVQSTIPLFNLSASGSPSADTALRLGIDAGRLKFSIETGSIVSDVITNAALLEKKGCAPGGVCISRAVHAALPARVATLFRFAGHLGGRDTFRTVRRLDALLRDDDAGEQLA